MPRRAAEAPFGPNRRLTGRDALVRYIGPWPSVLRLPRNVLAVLPLEAAAVLGAHTLFRAVPRELDNPNLETPLFLVPLILAVPILSAGVLIDRVNSHTLFYVGGALAAAGTGLSAGAPFFWPSVLGGFLANGGFGLLGAAALAYIVRQTPEYQRGRVLGVVGVASLSGWLLGLVVIGALETVVNWRVGLAIVTLATLAGIALARRYAVSLDQPRQPRLRFQHVFYTPNRLLLVNLAAIAVGIPIAGVFPIFFLGSATFGVDLINLSSSASRPLAFLVAFLAGVLSDRFGRLRVFVPSALFTGVVSALAAQAGHTMTFAILYLALTLGSGVGLTTKLMVVDRVSSNRIGAALATHTLLSTIGVIGVTPALFAAKNALNINAAALAIWPACALLAVVLALCAGESAPAHRASGPERSRLP